MTSSRGCTAGPISTRRLRRGNLRDEAYRVALEQALARDAAFVVISATDIEDVDDRRYRELQLLAGIVEGRLHLMAYALGAGATGMTFQDADIPGFLGDDLACLLWTCVGYPEYTVAPRWPAGRSGDDPPDQPALARPERLWPGRRFRASARDVRIEARYGPRTGVAGSIARMGASDFMVDVDDELDRAGVTNASRPRIRAGVGPDHPARPHRGRQRLRRRPTDPGIAGRR